MSVLLFVFFDFCLGRGMGEIMTEMTCVQIANFIASRQVSVVWMQFTLSQ